MLLNVDWVVFYAPEILSLIVIIGLGVVFASLLKALRSHEHQVKLRKPSASGELL